MALDSKDILFQRRNSGNTGFEEVVLKDVNNSYIAFGPSGDPEGLPDIPLSDIIVSGSFGSMTGQIIFADGVSGSLTSSAALVYESASGVLSVTASVSLTAVTASYTLTASYVSGVSFNGTASYLQSTSSFRPAINIQKSNTGAQWSIVAGNSSRLIIKPEFSDNDVSDSGSYLVIEPSSSAYAGNISIGYGQVPVDKAKLMVSGSIYAETFVTASSGILVGATGSVSGSSRVMLLVDSEANTGAAGSAAFRVAGNVNKERIEIVAGSSGTSVFQGRAVGGTLANPTPTPASAVQAWFLGGGFDGSIYTNQAGMYITTSQTFTTSSKPSGIAFQTTPSGSTTRVDRMTITDAGDVVVTNALTASAIQVNTLHVQTVTSSILFSSGSNKLGSLMTDEQQLTGSVKVTGSISVTQTLTPSIFGQVPEIQVGGNSGGPGFGAYMYSSTPAAQSAIYLNKSATSTIGSHASASSGERLGAVIWGASDGAAYQQACQFRGEMDGNFTGSNAPGAFVWLTNNGSGFAERMRLNSAGGVGIGTSTPGLVGVNPTRQYLSIKGPSGIGVVEVAATSADADGAGLGQLSFVDVNSTGDKRGALIYGLTSGTTANNRGGKLLFYTKPDNGTLIERMIIENTGNVLIGTANTSSFVGSGNLKLTGSLWFGEDTNLYRSDTNVLKTDDALHVVEGLMVGTTSSVSGRLKIRHNEVGGSLTISDSNDIRRVRFDSAYSLVLSDTSSADTIVINNTGSIIWKDDTNLYRYVANTLKTDGNFVTTGWIQSATDIYNYGTLYFGNAFDTNLYRSAANTLKTDDDLVVAGNLFVNGYVTASFFVPSGSFISGSALSSISASYATTASYLNGGREVLTANRTYYVRTDGSNSNNGLADTAGGAFLTVQKAVDTVCDRVDLNGKVVTIQVGNGTYSGTVILRPYIGAAGYLSALVAGYPSPSYVELRGNITSPSSVLLTSTSSQALSSICGGPGWYVNGFSFSTTGTGVNCILAADNNTLYMGTSSFGACLAAHITAVRSSTVFMASNYTITAGAATHYTAQECSNISVNGRTITLTGTPAFSFSFARALYKGQLRGSGNTYSGAATGQRYNAVQNSLIDAAGAGANYFPGNAAGATASGGQYT
jgi:hypothetical protein